MKIRNKIQLNSLDKKSAKMLVLIALFLIPFTFVPTPTLALSEEEQLNQVNQQIQDTKNKLSETQSQKRSLQGDVAYYEGQISQAQNKIYSLNGEVNRLNTEIAATQTQIAASEVELKRNRENLSEAMRIFYEEGQVSSLELVARSRNFSEFVDRSEYLQVMQIKVKEEADKVVALMNDLNTKKQSLADKKKATEDLRAEELVEKNQLAGQKSVKDQLLAVTKGNEAEYQAMVKKLQAQERALQEAIWSRGNSGGNYVSLGKVKAGDIIGYIGNTGYSTGCHLHFEIRNTSQSHVNPANYIGNGYYIHPVPGVRMNVGYGYSSDYFPGVFHTGVDYADGCRGTAIRATADGDIVNRVSGRPNTYPWSLEYGNYVKIRHTNGWYSLYGHLR